MNETDYIIFLFGKDIKSHLTAIFVACKTTQGLDILVPKVKTTLTTRFVAFKPTQRRKD